jgi:hypothetical protein
MIVLIVHPPSEEKIYDTEHSCCIELEQVSDHFSKYRMKIMLGDLNAELGRENIFNPTTGNNSQR